MKKISTICFPFKDGKIYLANKRRGFGEGFLNGYGGKQKSDDATVLDAAIREIREEAGIVVSHRDLEKVAVIDFFKGSEPIFECHVFVVRDWKGEFKASDEMDAAEPFDSASLPFERMWDADRVWLPLIFTAQGIHKIRALSWYDEAMKKQIDFKYEDM